MMTRNEGVTLSPLILHLYPHGRVQGTKNMNRLQIGWHISGCTSPEELARGREILCRLAVERVLKERGIMPCPKSRGQGKMGDGHDDHGRQSRARRS